MAGTKAPVVSIVMLIRQPRIINLEEVERAAECAFEVLFNTQDHGVIQVPNKPMFVVRMPEMALGIINANQPYFTDIAQAADATRDFAAKQAIQDHTAWISVDLLGDPSAVDAAEAYAFIGKLLAELVGSDTLALLMTPSGKITAYDKCFFQLLRSGNAPEIFKLGPVERTVGTHPDDPELLAAAAEARRRWPELVQAFATRRPGQGFGAKKTFTEGDLVEHMWVEISRIDGNAIHGKLSNSPSTVRLLKLGDPITFRPEEVEDWIYTDGAKTIGGFQIPILQRRR